MPEYFIQHKIYTIAERWDDFEFDGFLFRPLNKHHEMRHGWIASKTVEASNVDDAFKDFYRELAPLTDRISFVSQCYLYLDLESFLIQKLESPFFYMRLSRRDGPSPLMFCDEELNSLKALKNYQKDTPVFHLLREAINSHSFDTRLSMLSAAMEAIAGEIKKNKTDKDYIIDNILGDEKLYNDIFKSGHGIRNQILHGKNIDIETHGNEPYTYTIYRKIVDYFNNNHGTSIETDVVSAPRTLGENYSFTRGWYKISDDTKAVDLYEIDWMDFYEAVDGFELISGQPDNY